MFKKKDLDGVCQYQQPEAAHLTCGIGQDQIVVWVELQVRYLQY